MLRQEFVDAAVEFSFALACCRTRSRVAPTQRGGYRLTRLARSLIARRQWPGDFYMADAVRLRLDLAT